MRDFPLNKLQSRYASVVEDSDCKVLHVTKPAVLIQAAGYPRFCMAQDNRKNVYFRGQSKLYETLAPSLLRGAKSQSTVHRREERLNLFLKDLHSSANILRNVDRHVREALLQHYGLRTRWLDCVENVWVALWFACHEGVAFGKQRQYLHYEKRQQKRTSDSFAYVLLVSSASQQDPKAIAGCFRDMDSATIDLRTAVPSHFVRPHAQHGVVVRAHHESGQCPLDFFDMVSGVIRVELRDALSWLGTGDLLTSHSLFPPPAYDFGYQEILKGRWEEDDLLGAIQYIGASA